MEDAYVINLKTSRERWDDMQDKFKGTNIQLHRVDPVVVNYKGSKKTRKWFATRSLVLTFLKLIKMAKRRNFPEILVLEDDCYPVRGFEEIWRNIKSWLRNHPTQWDMYSGGNVMIKDPFLIGYTKDILFYRPKIVFGSHWIWAKRESYDKIIKAYEKELRSFDHIATDIINTSVDLVISTPFLAYQKGYKSTITGSPDNSEKVSRFQRQERSLRLSKTQRKIYKIPSYYSRKTRRNK